MYREALCIWVFHASATVLIGSFSRLTNAGKSSLPILIIGRSGLAAQASGTSKV